MADEPFFKNRSLEIEQEGASFYLVARADCMGETQKEVWRSNPFSTREGAQAYHDAGKENGVLRVPGVIDQAPDAGAFGAGMGSTVFVANPDANEEAEA